MAGYVLHDLALYAPASWYLGELWSKLIAKHLTLLFDYSNVMVNTLIALVYKSGLAGSPGLDDDGSGTGLLSKDIHDAVAADRAKGVLFFQVGIDTQKDICDQLNTFAKSRCPKGLVQYLLIDNGLGDNGVDLLRYLLILAPEASSNLLNSFDKIRLTDLIAILQTKKGSLVIQQLIRSSFFKYSREEEGKGAKKKGDTTVKNTATDRLARRLRESLFSLAADRHATFVVEVLYDTAEVETKELIVKALVPLFEEVRRPTKGFFQRPPPPAEGGNTEEGEGEANPVHTGPSLSAAKKILQKCFVEQYVYRKDEWKKLAQRQSQVHRLLGKMFLE
ncbi:hypothetical protein, conserved [Angomonas deanei]|uniref:Uncharacterized protein n=1 Tax=Angomonas deanei TaxID=59799 RepID=A0A7G2CPK0_9TRYP|nr:hypothetical protein, conserved [Angomonas deanei]